MKPVIIIISPILLALLSSCALVTVPVKIAGKVVTTSVGVVGKAAGAGFNAMKDDDSEEEEE